MASESSGSQQPNMPRDEILLEGDFEVFPNEKVQYKVEITRSGITYFPLNTPKTKKSTKYLHFGDVIGCRCRRSVDQKHSNKAYITVFAYPLKKKLFSNKWVRHKCHVTLARSCDSSFDGNRKVVEKWRRVILHLCQKLPVRKTANGVPVMREEDDDDVDIDVENCSVPPKTRLLVLVNPHSGPGKAMQIYKKQVEPMLDEADIQVKVIKTEHAGHGTEMMKTLNRREYYGVVIVSGDGLIYEVINGLMNRDDWRDAMQIPVGCIPGGSGNALACSINYSAGESIETDIVLHSTFILIKHRIIPMDLILVEQPSVTTYSFLSVTWGLLADIDYESEQYRAIGEARFTLQAIRRILGLRKYHAKISFLPITKYIPKTSINNNAELSAKIPSKKNRGSLQSLDGNYDASGEGFSERLHSQSVPTKLFRGKSLGSEVEDGDEEELRDIREPLSQNNVDETPASGDTEFSENGVEFSLSTDTETSNKINDTTATRDDTKAAPTLSTLPPLDASVPEDWIVIDDEFVTLCATFQTHMGSELLMAPDSRFSDGIMHLCIIRAGIGKTELLSVMGMLEKGTHIDYPSPYFEMVKVSAFRLEPDGKEGVIMVDGEKIPNQPLQAQVLPGMAHIMAMQ